VERGRHKLSYEKTGNLCIHNVFMCFERAHPVSYPVGTGVSFLGSKAAKAWSWPQPLSSAEAKNAWNYTSTPLYVFMALCSVKHRIHLHGVVLLSTGTNVPLLVCVFNSELVMEFFKYGGSFIQETWNKNALVTREAKTKMRVANSLKRYSVHSHSPVM
jgi:hypothetical protein